MIFALLPANTRMPSVHIPQKQYQELVDKSMRFEYLKLVLKEDIFSPPPTKDAHEIMGHFTATQRYSKKFLQSLKKGLMRSSFVKV